jgi:oligosaccharyltransferase complex subunit gamma
MRALYLRDFKWLISSTDGHVTSHKLLEFINKRTGRQIEYKPEFDEALNIVGLLIGIIAGTLFLLKFFKFFFLNTFIWFIGSCVVYVICIAGLVYNIIHNVPFTSVDKQGKVEWKTDANR